MATSAEDPSSAPTETAPASNASSQSADLLHLQLLPASSLPPHAALNNPTSTVSAAALVTQLLSQGQAFASTTLHSFVAKGGAKTTEGSAAPVEILSWTGGPGETWFARRSRHADKREKGTAEWSEFDDGLRAQHSRHEAEYTPGVVDAHRLCGWEGSEIGAVEGWEALGLEVYEMAHKMPPPLTNRFFPVLVATARATDTKSLIVVQVPIDLQSSEAAKYSNGKTGKLVRGVYVSVEHVRVEEDGTILWEMATASDAKGVLPMPLQKLGVPGAILKDVGLFLGWVERNRHKG